MIIGDDYSRKHGQRVRNHSQKLCHLCKRVNITCGQIASSFCCSKGSGKGPYYKQEKTTFN